MRVRLIGRVEHGFIIGSKWEPRQLLLFLGFFGFDIRWGRCVCGPNACCSICPEAK